jgi:hypothetical protein
MDLSVRAKVLEYVATLLVGGTTKEKTAEIVNLVILFEEEEFFARQLRTAGAVFKLRLP